MGKTINNSGNIATVAWLEHAKLELYIFYTKFIQKVVDRCLSECYTS